MPTVYRNRKPGRGAELPINLTPTQIDTFWLSVEEGPNGCWEWVSPNRVKFGYGRFHLAGVQVMAHRVSWTILRGPIPQNQTLDHLCRNPRCVNPDHLEIVSNKENILRGNSPTAMNARKTHCKQGHEFTPENTRWYTKNNGKYHGRRCKECYRTRRSAKKAWRSGKHKPKAAPLFGKTA